MGVWKIKGCSRCGGDAYVNSDSYGWTASCLQCGHVEYLKSIHEIAGVDAGEVELKTSGKN